MVASHQEAGLVNVGSMKSMNECTAGDNKHFDNGVTKDVESQEASSRRNSARSCTSRSTNKQRVSTTSTKFPKLTKKMRKVCTWKWITRVIVLYSITTAMSLALCTLSGWFYNYYVSTLWTPSGYFMLVLILWYDDGDMVTAMYGGLVTGYVVVFRILTLKDSKPNNLFYSDDLLFVINVGSDMVQITIGGAGLSWWCGKELMEMNLRYILSYKFFFRFIVTCAIIAPTVLLACNMMAYPYVKRLDKNINYGEIQLMWLIGSSTSSVSILWTGLVISATINGRAKKMMERRASLNNAKKRKVNACSLGTDIAELIFGDMQFQWFYIAVEIFFAGIYMFFSDFWVYPYALKYQIEPSVLVILLLSWIAWRHTPIIVVLFDLFCTITSSTLLKVIILPSKMSEVVYFRLLTGLFVDEIVTSITAIFIMITVQKYRKIYLELMREDEKLYVALRNAEDIKKEAKLFASISHELKTPLNVIQGFSTEITEYEGVPPEAHFYAKQISEASAHILTILSDLLENFRLHMTSFWIVRNVPVDLHLFWSKTCHKVVSLGQQCSIEVNYMISGNVPRWVKTDECRLAQIILNLGSNAVQYTSGDKVVEVAERRKIGPHCQKMKVDLELKYCPDIASINMRISDTGEGIEAELHESIERMLERSNQNLDDSQHLNPVCGLNIAAEIVKVMGGTIKIDSRVGEGTDFNVTIPVICCKPPTNKIQEHSTFTSTTINNIDIMIVEDSTVNRRLLDRMLHRLGYNSVVQASNGLDALNQANESSIHFDIVLLDLSMSVMGGLQLLSHLLEHGRPDSLVNTPIIITSGHVSDDMWDELEALGAAGRVDKPYDQEQIAKAIRAACCPSNTQSESSI